MPGKAAVTVALQPSGDATPAAPQKSCPFVLKKVMDIPPPNILEEGEDGNNAMLRTQAFEICYEFLDLFSATQSTRRA